MKVLRGKRGRNTLVVVLVLAVLATVGGVKLTYTQFDDAGTPLGQTSAEW